jgi:hypothetical protein
VDEFCTRRKSDRNASHLEGFYAIQNVLTTDPLSHQFLRPQSHRSDSDSFLTASIRYTRSLMPATIGLLYIRHRFARCSHDLKRLDSTLRSPIYPYLSSTVDGLRVTAPRNSSIISTIIHELSTCCSPPTDGLPFASIGRHCSSSQLFSPSL